MIKHVFLFVFIVLAMSLLSPVASIAEESNGELRTFKVEGGGQSTEILYIRTVEPNAEWNIVLTEVFEEKYVFLVSVTKSSDGEIIVSEPIYRGYGAGDQQETKGLLLTIYLDQDTEGSNALYTYIAEQIIASEED